MARQSRNARKQETCKNQFRRRRGRVLNSDVDDLTKQIQNLTLLLTTERKRADIPESKCFNCGKTGHISAKCYQREKWETKNVTTGANATPLGKIEKERFNFVEKVLISKASNKPVEDRNLETQSES